MKYRYLFPGFLALGMYGALNFPAQAQPDTNAPKGNNPPNLNMGGRGGRGGGGRGGMRQMTAEQQKQMRAQQTEMRVLAIKSQLTQGGYTDEAVQTAVANYVKEQGTAQETLQEQWQKLNQAVRAGNTPDTQMATMLNDFRESIDKEKERRATAYKTLDKQLSLSTKPALDALLMTMGLTGDEAAIVGQNGGGGMGGPGGMGGFGGGPGGMGGGPGGGFGGGGGGFGGGPGGGGGGFGGGPGGGFGGGPGGDMGGPPGPPPDEAAA